MRGQLLKAQDWQGMGCGANFRPAAITAPCSMSSRQLARYFYFGSQFHKPSVKWTRELRFRLAQQLISRGWSTKGCCGGTPLYRKSHLCREFRKVRGAPYAPTRIANGPAETQSQMRMSTTRRTTAPNETNPPVSELPCFGQWQGWGVCLTKRKSSTDRFCGTNFVPPFAPPTGRFIMLKDIEITFSHANFHP
jgi:hypothetical protein